MHTTYTLSVGTCTHHACRDAGRQPAMHAMCMVDVFVRPPIGWHLLANLYSANAGARTLACLFVHCVAMSRCRVRLLCTRVALVCQCVQHTCQYTAGRAPDAIQKSKKLSSASFSAACVRQSASGSWPSFLMHERCADMLLVAVAVAAAVCLLPASS